MEFGKFKDLKAQRMISRANVFVELVGIADRVVSSTASDMRICTVFDRDEWEVANQQKQCKPQTRRFTRLFDWKSGVMDRTVQQPLTQHVPKSSSVPAGLIAAAVAGASSLVKVISASPLRHSNLSLNI